MTVITSTGTLEEPAAMTRARRGLGPVVPHVAVAACTLYWAFPLTHSSGGRDAWVLTIGALLAVVALAAVRPWRVLGLVELSLAAALGVAPLLVCLLDPPHFFGASQAATYAYSAVLFLIVRAWATTANQRTLLLGLVLAAALAQVAWSLIVWISGGDPSHPMIGTFYWWNPYAAFLLVPAVAGAGLAAIGSGPLRLPGGLAAVLCSAGIVFSTSRATMTLLVAGWLAAAVIAVLSRSDLRTRLLVLARWAALAALTVTVTVLMAGPPFFAHRASALASTAARSAGQSVEQNSSYRVTFWHEALKVFGRHPLTGAGFGSFGHQAALVDPGQGKTALVHSGLLQAFSDGGLLLGGPLLVAGALVAVGLIRRLRRRSLSAEHGLVALVAAGTLLLGVHNMVDFDWTYPSSMAASALLAALVLSRRTEPADAATRPYVRAGATACVLLAASALVLGWQARGGGWHLTAPTGSSVAAPVGTGR